MNTNLMKQNENLPSSKSPVHQKFLFKTVFGIYILFFTKYEVRKQKPQNAPFLGEKTSSVKVRFSGGQWCPLDPKTLSD